MEISFDTLSQTQVRFEELPPVVWKKPFSSQLKPGNIEIWRFKLDSYLTQIPVFFEMLAAEEKARAGRFAKNTDRQSFIVARALLRIILGTSLGISPREIAFEYGKKKKPGLKNPCNPDIHFNVSHSGQCILIGVADEEIGIDVECYENTTIGDIEISKLFEQDEVSFINAQTSPAGTFHNLWTRKEALLKGTSEGINAGIKSLPCLNGTYLIKAGLIKSAVNWTVVSFDAAEFYTASIAYPGFNKHLTFYDPDDISNIMARTTQSSDITVKKVHRI